MTRRRIPSRQKYDIFCDSTSGDDVQSARVDHEDREDHADRALTQSQPLESLSVAQSQNRQFQQLIREPRPAPGNPFSKGFHKQTKRQRTRGARQPRRPSISADTFKALETVPESGPQSHVGSAKPSVSSNADQVSHLPGEHQSAHLLSVAARNVLSVDEQVAKHRAGQYDWILAIDVPACLLPKHCAVSDRRDRPSASKTYFGCNLLPNSCVKRFKSLGETCPPGSYRLLVTPLARTNKVTEVFQSPVGNSRMALPSADAEYVTAPEMSDSNTELPGEDISHESSVRSRADDRCTGMATSRSPTEPVARIEDSFEALDELEEQLEAFDEVARFKDYASKAELPKRSPSVRFATPQPNKHVTNPSSTSLRMKSLSEPRRPALRKSTSMNLDSPKARVEEKGLIQAPPKQKSVRSVASPSAPKPTTKSPKHLAATKFELPGESVSRQLREKKEARLAIQEARAATQRATQPTASSLRRAKSAKLPTRPQFELPGEAISRRKREEHEAQVKAQEEEDRKRREFKARPLPSKIAQGIAPRGTVASRARQNQGQTENVATPKSRPATLGASSSRPALLSASNQLQPRGRGLKADEASMQASRATSTSTCSISKRSSLSIEDVHLQKLRGHEIYQRDNSWTDDRLREKRDREGLAKLAREEAAEKSRMQSREWAAKQARKRSTIGSIHDVM